jgi:hypothetical protein
MKGSSTNNPPPSAERRASDRVHVRGRARVLLAPSRAFDAEMVDISEGGVCLTSPFELTLGTWCHLFLDMPAAPATQLSVSGHVCFCIEQHGVYRVGVHCADSQRLLAAVRAREPGAENR